MTKTIKFTLTPEGERLSKELRQALTLLSPTDAHYKRITELTEWLKHGSLLIEDYSFKGKLCSLLSILKIYSQPERAEDKLVSETFRKLHNDFFELSMTAKLISVNDA